MPNSNKGFTLIEVLLTLAIGSIVLSGLLTVFVVTSSAYQWGVNSTDIQYMARRAVNDMGSDIKEASKIFINPEANQIILNVDTDKEIKYYLNKDNLIRAHKGASLPIAESIKTIKFIQADNGLIKVIVETESKNKKYVLSTSVYPPTTRP